MKHLRKAKRTWKGLGAMRLTICMHDPLHVSAVYIAMMEAGKAKVKELTPIADEKAEKAGRGCSGG